MKKPAAASKPASPRRGRGRSRAISPEAKDVVRAAFIRAGRELLARGESKCSLRAVATAAGYSPGTIYQYFTDQRALLLAIREQDLMAAVLELEALAARGGEPADRIKAVCLGAVRYWRDHLAHFETLFAMPPAVQFVRDARGIPFGRSPVVVRAYGVFDRVVRDLLEGTASRADPKLAVDSLIAAIHGMIWFPHVTRTMDWSDVEAMVASTLDALIAHWNGSARPEG